MMENKTKIDLKNKSIFITGVAGFIGSNLAKRLLSTVEGVKVVGLDNMNNYYDVRLKEARLKELEQFEKFSFVKGNLADKAVIESIFEQYKPEIVVNLGAQAGVRYSITNPDAYVEANLIGFYNILEACRHSYDEGHTPVEHLVYASSSSVYGSNKKVPYSTDDKVDNPVSLYAATKKSNELMEDIKSGKINCIIVKDLSRLGRNYIEMGKYLEQIFPMMGIRFIAINDNYDNANAESNDSDNIVVPFKNLLNDSYCRDISIKVRSQLDMKRRKGEFIGGYAIYGYCKDERNKNRLVVDEYAADVVRSIYRRKLEGMSAQAIAEQLNSENVLAPSEYKRLCGLNYHSGFKAGTHAKWQAIQVLRILKNEVYTGTMVQGRRQKINYKIKKIRDVEESGWIRVPNMHEAIIPQKLFDTVQEVLKLDTCASKGQQTVNLFSGIVRCGGCGQNMVRRTVSKNGKKYIYLHCVTNHNGLGCSSHLISESKLEEVVLAALQGKIQQISGLEHRLDEINEIPKNERRLKSVEEHLKMLEQEEQKYQTLRRQLYEDMSSGIVSKEEYKEFSHSFNEKVEAIRKAKAEMNRQRDCLNNLDVEHLPWIEDFKSYQNLTSLNRRVLVELVESITVYDKEHIHIQYRFDQEIRNVLEYCSSVPAAETEESAV